MNLFPEQSTRKSAGLVKSVDRLLRDHSINLCNKSVLALVSGGIDSVVMVDALDRLPFGSRPSSVTVVFFDHGTRDVIEDRIAARQIAEKVGAEFHEINHRGVWGTRSLQAPARAWRYSSAAKYAKEINADVICTAHHADDNLESILMGMIGSSGGNAIAGIQMASQYNDVSIVRPLLSASKEQIQLHAAEAELHWVEDPTNSSDDYLRNQIRHTVVPALLEANSAAGANIARSSSRFATDAATIDELAKFIIDSRYDSHKLPLAMLQQLDKDAAKALLAAWLRKHGLGRSLTNRIVQSVYNLALPTTKTGASVDVRGACVVRERYDLYLQRSVAALSEE